MERSYVLNIFGIPPIIILFAVVAYFVYGNSVNAALAVVLLEFLWGIAMLVAFIPLVGIFIYWYLTGIVFNWVSDLTGLTSTWLTDVMLWINLAIAAFFWLMMTLLTIGVFRPHRECRMIDGKKVCRLVWR